MFLILKAKSALNPDYDSVSLKLLLCEDHEVFGIESDEVSEYNKNKGKARRRALGKRRSLEGDKPRHDGGGRSEVMEDLR